MSPAIHIAAIAKNTFREALRQKFVNFLVILAVALVLSANFFRQFDFETGELKFIADFGFGAILLFGSILAIVMSAQLFFAEMENRTALTMLAKPIRRWEFLTGKFAGIALLLAAFVLLMSAVLAGFLWLRENELMGQFPDAFAEGRLVSYSGLALYALVQWLKFSLLAAITLLIASFANTNLYCVVMAFFVMLICQLQYVAQERLDDIDILVLKGLAWTAARIFPNFQLFNVGQPLAFPEPAVSLPMAVPSIAGYAILYTLCFLGLTLYSFRHREI